MSPTRSDERGFPALTVVLPGRWVQVPVADSRRVEELLALLEQAQGRAHGQALRARLDQLHALGGDQLFVSTTRPSSVVLTSWPGETVHRTEDLVARAEGVVETVTLPHRDGWPFVRLVRQAVDGTAATYWLAHPRSGRVLAVDVTVDVPDFEHSRWRALDALMGELEWDEHAQEEDAGGAPR